MPITHVVALPEDVSDISRTTSVIVAHTNVKPDIVPTHLVIKPLSEYVAVHPNDVKPNVIISNVIARPSDVKRDAIIHAVAVHPEEVLPTAMPTHAIVSVLPQAHINLPAHLVVVKPNDVKPSVVPSHVVVYPKDLKKQPSIVLVHITDLKPSANMPGHIVVKLLKGQKGQNLQDTVLPLPGDKFLKHLGPLPLNAF